MRITLNIVAILLVLAGATWFLQGINVLPGSFMTGQIRCGLWRYRRRRGNHFIAESQLVCEKALTESRDSFCYRERDCFQSNGGQFRICDMLQVGPSVLCRSFLALLGIVNRFGGRNPALGVDVIYRHLHPLSVVL